VRSWQRPGTKKRSEKRQSEFLDSKSKGDIRPKVPVRAWQHVIDLIEARPPLVPCSCALYSSHLEVLETMMQRDFSHEVEQGRDYSAAVELFRQEPRRHDQVRA
jgi:hypothetical protein